MKSDEGYIFKWNKKVAYDAMDINLFTISVGK